MFLSKLRNRILVSVGAALLLSEILFVFSGYVTRVNWFGLAIALYILISVAFIYYMRYKLEKETMQESDEEILDDIDI
jgi:Ca2+/Na+ antiporter